MHLFTVAPVARFRAEGFRSHNFYTNRDTGPILAADKLKRRRPAAHCKKNMMVEAWAAFDAELMASRGQVQPSAGILCRQIASSLPNPLLPTMPPKKKVEEALAPAVESWCSVQTTMPRQEAVGPWMLGRWSRALKVGLVGMPKLETAFTSPDGSL